MQNSVKKIFLVIFLLLGPRLLWAQDLMPMGDGLTDTFKKPEGPTKVELSGDKVSYSASDNKARAEGNVVVKGSGATLTADKLEIDRNKNRVNADGHMYLDTPTVQLDAKSGVYNFNEGTGTFADAKVANNPYYLAGKQVDKISDSYYQMTEGYLTTCDHDVPHYRMQVRRMDYYQHDRAVAHGIRVYLGPIPVMYLPRYTYILNEDPWITFVPGKTKDFGMFLLTTIRQKINDNAKLTVHVDYRERKGVGEGFDYKYTTARTGSGLLKTYYINEYTYPGKHPWQKVSGLKPTTLERYKVEWRHRWTPDENTDIVTQYFKVSDAQFIKDYFERQYRRDPNTDTYFILTRNLPKGTLSFNIAASRVNRFNRGVEKLPEIAYSLNNQEIGDTGLYIKSQNTFSNLVKKEADPENHRKTIRFDTNNEVSYPFKIAFVETRPFVGAQQTYYSRSAYLDQRSILRNVTHVGSDFSTKVFKIWNYKFDQFGVKVDKLRHVVSPSITYIYQHRPSIASANLNQFDSIDSVNQLHAFRLALENKLQTKRLGETVDLLRFLLTSDFLLKDDKTGKPGLGPLKGDLEFKPNGWLTFGADAEYDHKNDRFSSLNFETTLNPTDQWSLAVGRRYAYDVDDEYTTELKYKINPKWSVKVFDRFDVKNGSVKEEQYVITRDLHEWEMDLDYHQYHGSGTDIMIVFRLKAFPDMDLNLASAGFNKRKAGSQSSP